jgi:23S rRNA pseudouridine1911/1915/1917 synthase
MTEHIFEISVAEAGDRADLCLARRLPLLSKTKLRALVAAGAATVNGKAVSIGVRMKAGDRLHFVWEPERIPPGYPEHLPLTVLYEDAELIAIDKPAGMLVHPTRGVKRGTLTNALLAHLNPSLSMHTVLPEGGAATLWPRFVHRLDRDTSGVVLAAKSAGSASALGKALAAGAFAKRYIAILGAALPVGRQEIAEPIGRYDEAPPHWRVLPRGQEARTVLECIASRDGLSLCVLTPVTGRTNQLRIHSAAIGAAIAGDTIYGGAPASRMMLHAWRLTFPHPNADGNRIALSTEIPAEFETVWPGIRRSQLFEHFA